MNSIFHKTTASQGAAAAQTAAQNQVHNNKVTDLSKLRAEKAAALAGWRRAEQALEQDRRLARAQRRREDPRLGPRVMEAYNLWDKLSSRLSWAEAAARPQDSASTNSGGFSAPKHPNRYTRQSTPQGTSVANRFSPLDESAKNPGANQGF